MGEHRLDIVEPVRGECLDGIDHALGAAAAIRLDDFRGLPEPCLLVSAQSLRDVVTGGERVGQRTGVEDGLAGAVGADRVHRVGGVSQQRHPTVRPPLQGIAVAHRVLPEHLCRPDQCDHVDLVDREPLDVREHLVEPSRPRPVLPPGWSGPFGAGLGHHRPVGEPMIVRRSARDRVEDDLGLHAAGDDHRAPGQERRPIGGSAPQHRPVPAGRPLAGIDRRPHGGMDSVGADEGIAAHRLERRTRAVGEVSRDAVAVLLEGGETVTGRDRLRAEAIDDRIAEHALQRTAVDRELRDRVTRVGPAKLMPDSLPEAVRVDQLVGPHPDRIEPLEQAERAQLADRVRQRVDPDAELADLR